MDDEKRRRKLDQLTELLQTLPAHIQEDDATEWPDHELTMTQFKALTYLQKGPQRMGDVSRFLGVSLSSATNLVSRLENKGLVQRLHDTSDRRVVTCELTDEGRRTVTFIWQVGRERLVEIARHLPDAELDRVIDAFEILLRAAQRSARTHDDS